MLKNNDMNDFPDIIKTGIIDSKQDAFWHALSHETSGLQPLDVLIITLPMQGSEEAQLQKMMQACKLDPSSYNIVQVKEAEPMPWHQLRDALQPKVILLLGILPQQLGIAAQFYMYSPNKFNDCVWIAAPSLAQLEQQSEAKKQLWNVGLKPVFVDKTL
ncbi:MAG: hypothetical protein EOP56_06280 [Sphingobacteriales bacterium]|nr:MAG: hypothetical protein EOP56_06280 [Sphingobacteriales bacterium]